LFLLYLYSAFGSSTTECFRRAKRKAQKRYVPYCLTVLSELGDSKKFFYHMG